MRHKILPVLTLSLFLEYSLHAAAPNSILWDCQDGVETDLRDAVYEGNLEKFQQIFQLPNDRWPDKTLIAEAVCMAAFYNHFPIVQFGFMNLLTNIKYDAEHIQEIVNGCLSAAACAGNLDIMHSLMLHEAPGVPHPDLGGLFDALWEAVLENKITSVRFLMTHEVEGIAHPSNNAVSNALKMCPDADPTIVTYLEGFL